MPLFGKKKQAPAPPPEEQIIPTLPTIDDLNREPTEPLPKDYTAAFENLESRPPHIERPIQPQRTSAPTIPTQTKTGKPETAVDQNVAPLFIKLERYRNILSSINSLKTNLTLLRHSLAVLDELEKVRGENMRVIQEAIETVEKKIAAIDESLIRPTGLRPEAQDAKDVEALEGTIVDLKSQISNLKSEMYSL